jgi:hypothetical protein
MEVLGLVKKYNNNNLYLIFKCDGEENFKYISV